MFLSREVYSLTNGKDHYVWQMYLLLCKTLCIKSTLIPTMVHRAPLFRSFKFSSLSRSTIVYSLMTIDPGPFREIGFVFVRRSRAREKTDFIPRHILFLRSLTGIIPLCYIPSVCDLTKGDIIRSFVVDELPLAGW